MPTAITTRLDLLRSRATLSHVGRTVRSPIGRAVLCVVLLNAVHAASAQSVVVQPAVQIRSVTTNNVSFAEADAARSDSLLVVTPRLDVLTVNPGYRLNASLSADAVTYLGRSQADRLLPRAQADLTAQLVERWLFVDGTLSADTTAGNPFGVLEDESSTLFNRTTVYRQRISPYVERELSPRERLQLRTDHSWFQNRNAGGTDTRIDTYLQSQRASYELRPQPLGLRTEYTRDSSDYSSLSENSVLFETARLSAMYEAAPQLVLTLTAGRDHARYSGIEQRETLRGFGLRWTPSERTSFDALIEKRFFGTGWAINLAHRTPFLVVNADAQRRSTTYAAQVAALPAGGDVAQLLDSLLSTRITNPVERATAVQQLIAQRGLPATLASALDLFSPSAQVLNSASLSAALLGVRHTITLRGFHDRTADLIGANPPPLFSSNARQYGASLGMTRRLQPDTTADFSLTRNRVVGFGTNQGVVTNNLSVRFGASRQLSLRTTVSAALRRQWVDSTTVTNANQTTLSFGLLHRF
jgi:uncharacterized protein (PEP-CTERM system associated)